MSTPSPNRVRPKLVVRDAAAALDWYRQALGATVVDRYEADGTIVFAQLEVLGTTVTLKDEDGFDPAPQTIGAPGPVLDVVLDDPDALAKAMLAAGAEVIFPVEDRDYGARAGRVRDPFGVQWLLSTPVAG